ncbi:MAG: SusD/RagB family nutrient-binding outer membrane lipoprotein [Saprospiraceae bacterium]|nr:SusD/RagB family nutrient-binding outer membrane lipoprotein [Saprospiraceae bacterium]
MKFLKLFLIMLAVALVGFSCTDDFDELNTNPLALTADKVDASLIGLAFAKAQYNIMRGASGYQISQNLFADMYCQYFAVTHPNFPSDRYTQVGRWSNSAWVNFYNKAPNVKFVEDFTAEQGLAVQNAVAKIWRVQAYHRVTDFWGPVPYSQFGNGELSVPYDQQEAIYRSFFPTLDEAVSVLNANLGGSAFGSNDLIFSGDVASWVTFANSLRLRLAMRIRYVDPGLAKAEAEKAVAAGVMTSNEQNATVLTTANSFHPLNQITAWSEFRMSTLMESILEGYEDPRLPVYFAPAANGDSDDDGSPFEGLRNGQSQVQNTNPNNNLGHSDLADYFRPVNQPNNPPIEVMSAAEVYLLRAEGALVGWNMGGTAQELYEQGIRASMQRWAAADDAAIDAYIASSNVPADASAESPAVSDIPVAFETGGDQERQLEQIITQKWLALYPDGFEAFAELRRTGYPKQYTRLNSENLDVGVGDLMRRMKYESSEFSNNRAEVEAAIASPEIGGQDKNSTKLWWDKK